MKNLNQILQQIESYPLELEEELQGLLETVAQKAFEAGRKDQVVFGRWWYDNKSEFQGMDSI